MSEFEKWYKEKYYKYDLYPKYAQFRKEIKEAWQAATAESDKRIAELKANTSQMVQAVSRAADAREAGMENEIIALQAHINVLREALEKIATADIWQNKYAKFADEAKKIATDAISETSAQHINDDVRKLKGK